MAFYRDGSSIEYYLYTLMVALISMECFELASSVYEKKK